MLPLELSEGEHSAILSTFIKLPFVIKIFVFKLSIFEWPFYTGFPPVCSHFIGYEGRLDVSVTWTHF